MDHHRSRRWLARIRRIPRSPVLEVEPFRKLEIQLNRRALERPLQRVFDRDIYLGTVERPVARVNLPISGVVIIKRFPQLLFAQVFHSIERAQ